MSNIIIGKTLLSSNTPKRGDKGILINNKYFIPFSSGNGNEFYKCTSVQTPQQVTFYRVSNAEYTVVNGDYKNSGSSYNGQPIYSYTNTTNNITYYLFYSGYNQWGITDTTDYNGDFVFYSDCFYTSDDSNVTGEWLVSNRASGLGYENTPPTVTAQTEEVGNKTWSGKKAVLNNGVYEYESDSTSDLEYSSITPVVGRIYNGNALASISSLYTGLPINGLIFYAPLTENRQTSETRESFYYYNTVSFQSIENVQCGRFYGSMINFTPQNYPSNNITLSAWYYKDSNSAYDATGFFGYGSGSGRAALIENQYGVFCLEYDGGRISSNTQINTNRWYHLAIAIGQNSVMFYMNGVLVSTNSYSANIISNNGVIGGLNSSYMCNCYVAGCRIYNRLLEEFEIQALSNEFSV